LWVNLASATKRSKAPHEPHPLERKVERAPGGLRIVGISTTNMNEAHPRVSTSDLLLRVALDHARATGARRARFA